MDVNDEYILKSYTDVRNDINLYSYIFVHDNTKLFKDPIWT